MREYTVLLDPPVFAPEQRGRGAASRMPAVGGAAASRPDFPSRAAGTADRRAPCAAGGGDSYEVQRGDSLSAIARRLSASTGARTDQLMVLLSTAAIRGAFEGDMNRLRAGAVLRIPSGDEIAAVSPAEARGEVRRRAVRLVRVGAASGGGRLRLVPPSDSRRARVRPSAMPPEVDALQSRVRELEGQLTESSACSSCAIPNLPTCRRKLAASQQQPAAAQPADSRASPPVEQPLPQPEAVTPRPEATAPEAAAPTPEPRAADSRAARCRRPAESSRSPPRPARRSRR